MAEVFKSGLLFEQNDWIFGSKVALPQNSCYLADVLMQLSTGVMFQLKIPFNHSRRKEKVNHFLQAIQSWFLSNSLLWGFVFDACRSHMHETAPTATDSIPTIDVSKLITNYCHHPLAVDMNYDKFDNTTLHSLTNMSTFALALKSLRLRLFLVIRKRTSLHWFVKFFEKKTINKNNFQLTSSQANREARGTLQFSFVISFNLPCDVNRNRKPELLLVKFICTQLHHCHLIQFWLLLTCWDRIVAIPRLFLSVDFCVKVGTSPMLKTFVTS